MSRNLTICACAVERCRRCFSPIATRIEWIFCCMGPAVYRMQRRSLSQSCDLAWSVKISTDILLVAPGHGWSRYFLEATAASALSWPAIPLAGSHHCETNCSRMEWIQSARRPSPVDLSVLVHSSEQVFVAHFGISSLNASSNGFGSFIHETACSCQFCLQNRRSHSSRFGQIGRLWWLIANVCYMAAV